MGECGCTGRDEHYRFPGPGKTFYILTLSASCTNCDAPAGICIRHVKPGEHLHEYAEEEHYLDGRLRFEMWGDGSGGVAVKTGMIRSEFIKATLKHLVGIDSKKFADDGKREIDEDGADVILEEMYADADFAPELVVTKPA
jgi:hypothetical protein